MAQERKQKFKSQRNSTRQITISQLNSLISHRLGNHWGLCSFGATFLKIGLVDKGKDKREDGTSDELFGHYFEIYIDSEDPIERGLVAYGEKQLKINYGCMGSFEPAKETSRVEFLQGLAKFASDSELQHDVLHILDEYNDAIHGLCEAYKEAV